MKNIVFTCCLLLTLTAAAQPLGPGQAPAGVPFALAALVNSAVAQGFTGSVLVARGAAVLHASSHGPLKASDADGPKLSLQSPVRLASITKQVVSTLVMQEVQAGRLRLDDPLGKQWPDYPLAAARAVTVRHLLMHQSGLPKPPGSAYAMAQGGSKPDSVSLHQAAAAGMCAGLGLASDAGSAPALATLSFAPGQGFNYNNCDYLVLGALLERINGNKPLAALLRERVLQPANMQTAKLCEPTDDVSRQAQGSELVHGKRLLDTDYNPAPYGAAGALCGAIGDVLAYNLAWQNGTLLSAASKTQQTKANDWGAALGVWAYPFGEGASKAQMVERQGWINGIRWLNLLDTTSNTSVIVLSTKGELDLSTTNSGKGLGADLLKAALAIP